MMKWEPKLKLRGKNFRRIWLMESLLNKILVTLRCILGLGVISLIIYVLLSLAGA